MKRDLIGLASLAMIAMQKRNKGGLSVSYDFSMLEDHNFQFRALARYKKKYPRVRFMPKLMKGFDLFVFWFPFERKPVRINGTITHKGNTPLVGEPFTFRSFVRSSDQAIALGLDGNIYKNFEQFYHRTFERTLTYSPTRIVGDRIDYVPRSKLTSSRRGSDLTGEQQKVLSAIKEASQNPDHKILIINSGTVDNPEQFTPIMMLHDLCEVITLIEANSITDGSFNGFTKIVKGGEFVYRVPILPKTPNIERWLSKPSLWYNLNDSYGLDPMFYHGGYLREYNDSDLLADCFAQKMATGKLEWLTIENSPAFKAFYENQYSYADEVIFPTSYQPFIQQVHEAIDRTLKMVNSGQIFVLD